MSAAFRNLLNGSKDISQLSHEWQQIVVRVLDMKKRMQFGIQIQDADLTDKEKLAVECCQDAISEKSDKK